MAHLRIVVIDDHPAVCRALAFLLDDDAYELVFHSSACAAMDVIRRADPTLVLIDLHLEYPSAGLDVVRALRADPATAGLPLIVWSTDPDVGRQVAALNLPAVTSLSKYDAGERLRAAIAHAAATAAGRAEHTAPRQCSG